MHVTELVTNDNNNKNAFFKKKSIPLDIIDKVKQGRSKDSLFPEFGLL